VIAWTVNESTFVVTSIFLPALLTP